MLNPQIFYQINLCMGPLEIDLFASRLTKQLLRFCGWRPDPTWVTDAFNQDWSQIRGYANPTVPNSTMTESGKEPSSKGGDNHPTVDITTIVYCSRCMQRQPADQAS